jgi:hypothetical protein
LFFVKNDDGEFLPPPLPEEGIFESLCSTLRDTVLKGLKRTAKLTNDEFLHLYEGDGRKLKIYSAAIERFKSRGLRRSDAYVCMFVKAEKLDLWVKQDPVPRIIQPRRPVYNLEVGKYLKAREHDIYDGIDEAFSTLLGIGPKVVMKHLNAVERAAAIREQWEQFDEPVVIPLDARRFDQHVSTDGLKFEHSWYTPLYPGDSYFKKLLSWQLETKGYVNDNKSRKNQQGKIVYYVKGKRMSGDMNTALGNVILMCSMAFAFLKDLKRRRPNIRLGFVDDGDDCFPIVEKRDLLWVKSQIAAFFLRFGFTMEIGEPVDLFEKIEFCQTQPVWTGERWIMCRDPRKAIERDLASVRPFQGLSHWRTHMGQIGLCGLAIAGDVPVFNHFYKGLVVDGVSRTKVYTEGIHFQSHGLEERYAEATNAARVSFYKAFEITPGQQRALEALFDLWQLEYSAAELRPRVGRAIHHLWRRN